MEYIYAGRVQRNPPAALGHPLSKGCVRWPSPDTYPEKGSFSGTQLVSLFRKKGNVLGGPTPYKSSLAALAAARTCIHHVLKFPSNSRILSFRLSNDTREPTACLGAVQLEEERY